MLPTLRPLENGARITVRGLVLVRQRPGSAKGVMFITLEDETGIANLIVWPSVFEQNRRTILGAQMLACRGKVQKASGVTHLDRGVSDRSVGHAAADQRHGSSRCRPGAATKRGMAAAASIRARPKRSARCGTSTSPTCTSIR